MSATMHPASEKPGAGAVSPSLRWRRAGGRTRLVGRGLVIAVASLLFSSCKSVDDIRPLDVELAAIRVLQYSGGTAGIEVDWAITNPNDFEILLSAVDAMLTVGGEELGPIRWNGEAPLRGSGTTVVTVPAEYAVGDHGHVYTAIIDGEALEYACAGQVVVERGVIERELGFEVEGQVGTAGRLPD